MTKNDPNRPGAPQETMAAFEAMAGDGSLDERCARVLSAMHAEWDMPAPSDEWLTHADRAMVSRVKRYFFHPTPRHGDPPS